jgi:hypothetical protein
MREHALNPKQRRRFIATTDSDHNCPIFPNLAKNIKLDGDRQASEPEGPLTEVLRTRNDCAELVFS